VSHIKGLQKWVGIDPSDQKQVLEVSFSNHLSLQIPHYLRFKSSYYTNESYKVIAGHLSCKLKGTTENIRGWERPPVCTQIVAMVQPNAQELRAFDKVNLA